MTHAALKDLIPCPFCGEAENLLTEHMEGTVIHPAYRIRCDNCGASSAYTDKDFRAAWNRRSLSAMEGEASAVVCLVTEKRYPHFAEAQIQLYNGYEPKIGDRLYTAPPPQQAEDTECRHDAWEVTASGAYHETRDCADCGQHLGRFARQDDNPTPSPGPQGGGVMLERWGRGPEPHPYLLQRLEDGYWTPWHIAQAAVNATATPPAQQSGEVGEVQADAASVAPEVVARLRAQVVIERESEANSLRVAELLQPEMDLFNGRPRLPCNTYTVRMAVDHRNCAKKYGQLANDLEAAIAALAPKEAGHG